MNEIWKDIPGYEGCYQVSTLGRVKTVERLTKRKNGTSFTVQERIKKQRIGTSGYYMVDLKVDRKSKTFRVHKLVAMTFLNHTPNKYKEVVDHIDNNKLNNLIIKLSR